MRDLGKKLPPKPPTHGKPPPVPEYQLAPSRSNPQKNRNVIPLIVVVGIILVALLFALFKNEISEVSNPISTEKYTEQINEQTNLIIDLNGGVDRVYWMSSGNKLHIFDNCQHIRSSEIIGEGTVREAWEDKNKNIGNYEICKTCINRVEKLRSEDIPNKTLINKL